MNIKDLLLRDSTLKAILPEEKDENACAEDLEMIKTERENARKFNFEHGIYDSINDPFDVLKLTVKRANKYSSLIVKKNLSLLSDFVSAIALQTIKEDFEAIHILQNELGNGKQSFGELQNEIAQMKQAIMKHFSKESQDKVKFIVDEILTEQEKMTMNENLINHITELQNLEREILSQNKIKQKRLNFQQQNDRLRQKMENEKRKSHFTK